MKEKTDTTTRADSLRAALRDVRKRYDLLRRGETAAIRRCRSADEVALEGAYWRIGEGLAHKERHLPHVVLLFPLAKHGTVDRFSFGRYLRRQLGDSGGASLRVRRLLDSRDRDDLDHREHVALELSIILRQGWTRGRAPRAGGGQPAREQGANHPGAGRRHASRRASGVPGPGTEG